MVVAISPCLLIALWLWPTCHVATRMTSWTSLTLTPSTDTQKQDAPQIQLISDSDLETQRSKIAHARGYTMCAMCWTNEGLSEAEKTCRCGGTPFCDNGDFIEDEQEKEAWKKGPTRDFDSSMDLCYDTVAWARTSPCTVETFNDKVSAAINANRTMALDRLYRAAPALASALSSGLCISNVLQVLQDLFANTQVDKKTFLPIVESLTMAPFLGISGKGFTSNMAAQSHRANVTLWILDALVLSIAPGDSKVFYNQMRKGFSPWLQALFKKGVDLKNIAAEWEMKAISAFDWLGQFKFHGNAPCSIIQIAVEELDKCKAEFDNDAGNETKQPRSLFWQKSGSPYSWTESRAKKPGYLNSFEHARARLTRSGACK
mmetsp:Transcript_124926/g.233611  ORF Transcript_124926/g.233611 Transcript_124926/m.233611 type:complete len:374 (-) Transcript_124926:21-1142(-)